jgi:hypothetical protein
VLDHIGFDVKDLQAFIKKLEANGIKLDRPYTKNEQTGAALAFITDSWGTYIELNERPNPVYLPKRALRSHRPFRFMRTAPSRSRPPAQLYGPVNIRVWDSADHHAA